MTTYYKNKYRSESIRLQNWDYRWNAPYFITICTANREHYFGEILNGKMNLSNIGVLADIFWHEIKNHSKNIKLDAFVVMPNHIHAILILYGNTTDTDNLKNDCLDKTDKTDHTVVGTGHALSLQPYDPNHPNHPKTIGQQRFQNIGKNSVSSIIGSYKSAVTKHARRLGYEFEWQRLFYEHIIQDEHSYERISNYIKMNVEKWGDDRFYDK